jgi:hypothetical protein
MNDLELREISERYRKMSEPELMDVARKYEQLTVPAQNLLREEFSRRSLLPPLLDEDPGFGTIEHRNLVTIRTYRDLPEAFIARSVLESAGIECFLQDENTVRADWLWSNLIGGARLQVAAQDEAVANEILSQPIPSSFPTDTGADFEQPTCPKCGSLDVEADDKARKITAASLGVVTCLPLVLALPAFFSQRSLYNSRVWKCSACGCVWQYASQPEPDPSTPVN